VNGRYPDVVGPEVIRAHALGLAEIAGQVPLDGPVATCPGWSVADLVWHLTEVELFWAHVIGNRPDGPDSFEEPTRPPDPELIGGLERAATALVDALTGVEPHEPAWSWSDDRTVGFTLRRQSHEAVVHHVDGRLAAGADLPAIAPRLAADGVDEMIVVMLTGVPDWASFERRPGVIELRTRDTGDTWTLAFGRMIGTSPESGTAYDLDALDPVDEPPDAVVEGAAADLHLWLCGRGDLARLDVRGDDRWVRELRSVASSI
jgi:uncharacterized protein (TIGR03083 family)